MEKVNQPKTEKNENIYSHVSRYEDMDVIHKDTSKTPTCSQEVNENISF